MEKRSCLFQTYLAGYWYCKHPKNEIYNQKCNRDVLCSHRESARDMECELAKTLLYLNIDTVTDDTFVKHCGFFDGCKKDKVCPECIKERTKEWAEKYKKDFEVIG